MTQTHNANLTVADAAQRLGLTTDGVYKLIQRGKLEAVRRSTRKTTVTEAALEQYVRSQQAAVDRFRAQAATVDVGTLRAEFEKETGYTPEDWLSAWRHDVIADTADNMRLLVRAAALRERDGEAPIHRPTEHPWAVAAFDPASRSTR